MTENKHQLTAKGAAFDSTFTRVDPTGTGGWGKAVCHCGWMSDDLPSGKQRVVAFKKHKNLEELGETNELPQDEPVEEEPAEAQRWYDFRGNYAIEMVPFAGRLAEAAGLAWSSEIFKGELRRRVYVGGPEKDVEAFLDHLSATEAQALVALREWQKDHRDERRGQTDQQLYVANREFLREYGVRAAKEMS